jgi:hypothetical protein
VSRRALHLEARGGLYTPRLPLEVSELPRRVRLRTWPALTGDDARFPVRPATAAPRALKTRERGAETPSRESPSKTGGERP